MQINPELQEYMEIHEIKFPELERDRQVLDEAMQNGQIVALSHDKDALHKLQDDLRKAGYKQAR